MLNICSCRYPSAPFRLSPRYSQASSKKPHLYYWKKNWVSKRSGRNLFFPLKCEAALWLCDSWSWLLYILYISLTLVSLAVGTTPDLRMFVANSPTSYLIKDLCHFLPALTTHHIVLLEYGPSSRFRVLNYLSNYFPDSFFDLIC